MRSTSKQSRRVRAAGKDSKRWRNTWTKRLLGIIKLLIINNHMLIHNRYKDPLQQMKIVYTPGSKGKTYIETEDVFLVCMMHKLGYPHFIFIIALSLLQCYLWVMKDTESGSNWSRKWGRHGNSDLIGSLSPVPPSSSPRGVMCSWGWLKKRTKI